MNIENILERQGRGKTTEERHEEYLLVRDRVKKFLKKKKIPKSTMDDLIRDGTLVLCVKWDKGFDVSSCLARHIGRNDLALTMKETSPSNLAYVKQLVNIYNSVKITGR